MSKWKRYIGDKAFYRMLILLVVPMIIQQGITNFVSLLDNLMVGSLGTEPMSGVAIVNQLIFVFNLGIFGVLSGGSIFGAQFFGVGDHDGVRHTFRFKLLCGVGVTAAAVAVLLFFGENLVALFLNNEANVGMDTSVTMGHALSYLKMILWGLPPFMIVQVYGGTLREMGETKAPMVASVIAVFLNLCLNYVLIYGHFGFPRMGVAGAALATVIARYVEMLYVMAYTHRSYEKYPFVRGVYRSMHVPGWLVKRIVITGFPLFLNEILWSIGSTAVNQSYSTRGLAVVAATNIATTAWQLFCVIMFAMGSAVSILVGQRLGAGDIEGAKDTNRKLLFFSTVLHVAVGLLIIAVAPFIPLLYQTEPAVRKLATELLMIAGASLPIHAFIHAAYFAIRSGGKTLITFLFDSVYMWCVPVVLAFVLCRYTSLGIITIYFIIQFSDVVKLGIGAAMLKSGFWANNVIEHRNA
ncbi:MAG: MATE family efflux transporter [Clostridia bacterium]|nr:MATE family efflux transporter [Clostridia bacterium]